MSRTAWEFSQQSGQAAYLPRELEKEILPDYRVEPGDELLVETADSGSKLELPGGQIVQPDGTISIGRHGRLNVVDKTVDEIKGDVESLIAGDSGKGDPITVRLLQPEGSLYYVLGEVSSPGAYPLKGRETVLDGILKAGDLTDRANRKQIILARPSGPGECRTVLPICYRHIVQLADTSTNYQLMPGDRIFIASLTFWDEICQLCAGRDEGCLICEPPQVPCPSGTPITLPLEP